MRKLAYGMLVAALFAAVLLWQQQRAAQQAQQEAAQLQADNSYRFLTKPCWFEADWQASIRCGELHTPKNRGAFVLPVVIIGSDGDEQHGDPLVYLTGGPGASARLHAEGVKDWLSWLNYANLGRDLILMDPRGTGGATPALQCDAYNRFNQRLLELHMPLAEELEQNYRLLEHCLAHWAQLPQAIKPEYFGTRQSAEDVRALMALLPYRQWNLLGVSYGSRLALEVARQENELPVAGAQPRLRSLILDSVYPAGYGGVQTWPQVLDEAFTQFFRECASSRECLAPLGDLAQQPLPQLFMDTLGKLAQTPVELRVARWDGEAPVGFMVNDHRFLSASFAAIYHPAGWSRITAAMADVLQSREENLLQLVTPFINNSLSADFNSLAFMLVDCADNPVASEQEYRAAVEQFPLLADYTRDQWRYQACHLQQLATTPGLQLREPQVPTLMLSGELDPITPPTWAQDLKQRWPGLQWIKRNQVAHSVLAEDPCVLADLGEFLNRPQAIFAPCNQQAQDALLSQTNTRD